jgi:hypothetical protein
VSAQLQQSNSFSAHLALAGGVHATITAPSLSELAIVVGKLHQTAANDTPEKVVVKDTAKAKPEAEAGKGTPAPSPTPAPASAPAAASGSASGADTPGPTYDDVKARVLALAKISRDLATTTLGVFKTVGGDKVDHGNKLQLPDYPTFIAAADKAIEAAKVAA